MCHWMTWKRFDGIVIMKDLVHRALEFHAFWLIIIYLVYRISVHLLLSQAKNFIFSSLRTQLLPPASP